MPGQAQNPGFADAAQREPRLESPDQPRWHNHLLEVRPESRAQKVWLYKQLFHAVKELGVCPRFSIRESRGGSFVINAVNGTTDLRWEPLPGSHWHRKVASVGRFRHPFHQERACYP